MLDSAVKERAQKNQAVILKAIQSVGLKEIAKATGVDESTICRLQETAIPRIAILMALGGIKAVPAAMRCFDPKDIETILHQAKRWMAHIGSADDLKFGDD